MALLSPYARRGFLWRLRCRLHGEDGSRRKHIMEADPFAGVGSLHFVIGGVGEVDLHQIEPLNRLRADAYSGSLHGQLGYVVLHRPHDAARPALLVGFLRDDGA